MPEYRAVIYDTDGYVMRPEDFVAWVDGEVSDVEPREIVVATGTALPRRDEGSEFERGPSSYQTLDLIAEWDVSSDEPVDVIERWDMAQRIALALTEGSR